MRCWGKTCPCSCPEPDRSRHDGYLQRYLDGQGVGFVGASSREVHALRRDGSTVPIRLSVGRVQVDGDPLFVGFISDLSQRRAMEQELKRNEEQLRSLMANRGHVSLPPRSRLAHVVRQSDAVVALTGWQPEDFLEGRIHFSQLTVLEDVPRLWDEVSAAIEQKRPYHVKFRLVDKQGITHCVREWPPRAGETTAQVLWIDGVIMDMTFFEQRNAEFESTVRAIDRALAVIEFDLNAMC